MSMPSRLRRRAPSRTTARNTAAALPLRPAHGRDTRHASIRNYAELSESEDDEDEDEDEDEEKEEEEEQHGRGDGRNRQAEDGEASEDSSTGGGSDDDGEFGDADFTPRRRPSKRPHLGSAYSSENSPSKRRRQPQRRATAEFLSGDDVYLSPSSDGAPRRRPKADTSSSVATRSSPRTSGRNERDRNAKRTPTKLSKHVVIRFDDGESAGGQDDGVRTPSSARTQPPPPPVKRPPWNTLPYLILASIFAYGAAPLDNIASVRWLLAASRTCRAFAEPALRALYESPPLLTMNMAHNLVDHLARDPATTMFDYRRKVKALRIDVGSLASRVYKGRHLDIPSLAAHCPRLADLDLYHYKDMPPYRQQTENLRWTYPQSLFVALGAIQPHRADDDDTRAPQEEGSSTAGSSTTAAPLTTASATAVTKLKSWRWNQRLMGRDLTLDSVLALHLSPTFAGLRKISFVNYQRPSLLAKDADDPEVIEDDRRQAEVFAGLLNALPSLTHLAVESSTAANDLLLPLLPKTLQHLELINCWDVTAMQFAEYLVTHGQQLRQLTLHHNQSLSLAFLPVLGAACPQLRALSMNLTYYSHHAFYNDSNPLYDCLMTADQVPTWPESIQVIELEHLRKWEPAAAEVFFQSLVDSAPRVPQLRVLAIKAMLDIPWRQRCEMRDRWEATLDRVFQRGTSAPEPASSLLYYDDLRRQESSPRSKAKLRQRDRETEPSRRSHRIATHVSNPSSRASSATRGLRKKAPGGRVSYREPDTDEDLESSDGYGTGEEDDEQSEEAKKQSGDEGEDEGDGDVDDESAARPKRARPFVHGMCDVVDIRIDNQKPGEIQYRMVDFLDSDDSNNSDEEWTGDGVEANDYAW